MFFIAKGPYYSGQEKRFTRFEDAFKYCQLVGWNTYRITCVSK